MADALVPMTFCAAQSAALKFWGKKPDSDFAPVYLVEDRVGARRLSFEKDVTVYHAVIV